MQGNKREKRTLLGKQDGYKHAANDFQKDSALENVIYRISVIDRILKAKCTTELNVICKQAQSMTNPSQTLYLTNQPTRERTTQITFSAKKISRTAPSTLPSPRLLLRRQPLPLRPPRINALLRHARDAAPPLKTGTHQRRRIDQAPRQPLHDLENLERIRHPAHGALAHLEHGQRDAKEGLAALVEEHVPHTQHGFNREGADEAGHEPGRRRERDGRQASGAVEIGVGGQVVDLAPHGRHRFTDVGHEDGNVGVGENDAVRAREVLGRDDAEHGKGLCLVFVKKQEQEAGEKVEGLAVAYAGVVDGKGLQNAAEGLDD